MKQSLSSALVAVLLVAAGVFAYERSAVAERTAAREAKDFSRADAIRDDLTARGIIIEDTPHGAVWHRKS